MVHLYPAKITPALWLLTWTLAAGAVPQPASASESELDYGGNLALTSDYIYRGVSESYDRAGALQADLHAETPGGTFAGLWASTRNVDLEPQARYDADIYVGHRIGLGSDWAATVSARGHYFVGGHQEISDDYQELSGAVSWLDRWTVSVAVIPNGVRYWYSQRLSRCPAWATDTAGQWLLGGGLFVTAGAGYYRSTGTGAGRFGATGYGYGNAGLAFERHRLRLDFGYFLAGNQARELTPYPIANNHFAGTVSWHF